MGKTDLLALDEAPHTFLCFAKTVAGTGWGVGRPGLPFSLLSRSRYNGAVSTAFPAVLSQFA